MHKVCEFLKFLIMYTCRDLYTTIYLVYRSLIHVAADWDGGPVPHHNFLRPEIYRSAVTLDTAINAHKNLQSDEI